MRKVFFMVLLLILAVPASAQRLTMEFPGLAERAAETVDVTLDAQMLRLAGKLFLGDADSRALGEMVQRLEGVYVRSYSFDKEGEYDPAMVERVRKQIGPNWKRLVNVKGRRENVDIFILPHGDAITGLVVISAEPKEFTIVNIVGPIDLEKLGDLEGNFGIPKITAKSDEEKNHD